MSATDEIMVGYRSQDVKCTLNPSEFPLAFAKNVTGKKVDEKSFESIKKWCGSTSPDWEPAIVKNEPTSGMRISGFVSRYSTSNKWFEVQDPRGFTLQISCDNLLHLIRKHTITRGVIQSECIWNGSCLIAVDDDYYKAIQEAERKKKSIVRVTASKLVVGQTYLRTGYGSLYTYLGRFHATSTVVRTKPTWEHSTDPKYLATFGSFDYSLNKGFVFMTHYCNETKPNQLKYYLAKTCPKLEKSDIQTEVTMDEVKKDLNIRDLSKWALPKGLSGNKSLAWNDKITITSMVIPEINFAR